MSDTTGEPGTPEGPKTTNGAETPSSPETPPTSETQALPSAAAAAPASPASPASPAGATPPAAAAPGPQPHGPGQPGSPTQQWTTAGAPAARRSIWGEAWSSTGGKLAVIVAGASLGLVALLTAGLLAGAFAWHVGDRHPDGPWVEEARPMPSPEQPAPGQRGPEGFPPGQQPREVPPGAGDLPNLGLPGVGGPLHGEAVVPGEGTATRAILFQSGEVTEVTADKLTVKSTDGFSATYTIGADSRDRLKKKVSTLATGDQVTVIAAKDTKETLRILKTGRAGPTS